MSLGILMGLLLAAGKVVDVSNAASRSRLSNLPSDAHAGFRINSNGTMQGNAATSAGVFGFDNGPWLNVGVNSDYEVRFTKNSGTALDTGTVDTWQVCSTTRTIAYAQSGIGTKGGNFTIAIREASSQVVISSTVITLGVLVEG